MMSILDTLLVIILTIGTGLCCARTKLLGAQHAEAFEIFCFKIALPCSLFAFTLHHDLAALFYLPYVACYLLSFALIASFITIYGRKHHSTAQRCMYSLAAGYVNIAIYAMPIITLLLGDASAGMLGILLQVAIIQPCVLLTLSVTCHQEHALGKKLLRLARNPLIIMPITGLLCHDIGVEHLSLGVIAVLEGFGRTIATIALFTFGLTIGHTPLDHRSIPRDVWVMVATKNLLHPLIAWVLGTMVFPMDRYWLYALMITCSAPTAFAVYLLAKHYAIAQHTIRQVVILSAIFSLASLTILACITG